MLLISRRTLLSATGRTTSTGAALTTLATATRTATATHFFAHVFELLLLVVGQNFIELVLGIFFQGFDLFLLIVGQVQLLLSHRRNDVETAALHSTGAARTTGLTTTGTCAAGTARGLALIRLSLEQARRCAECQRDEHTLYFHFVPSLLFFSALAVCIDAMQ